LIDSSEFKEENFCLECIYYSKCSGSIYGISFLEKYVLFKTLISDEDNFKALFDEKIKTYGYRYDQIEEFLKDKKKNCIYYNN
jgi:hypothetical protein